MNDTKETTPSYVELASQTYGMLVDAYAAANQRGLDYLKSMWEIASRPYASTAVETTVRENFDRANQIVALTVSELQTTGKRQSELTEKLVAHSAKVQDQSMSALRGVMNTGLSNLNYVRDTASQQFDDVARRFDEIGNRAAAAPAGRN